jgi:mono/diheme cytochrome c family protein
MTLLATGLTGQAGGGPLAVTQGAYTAEQAQQGEVVFFGRCADCHVPEEFTNGYMMSWEGTTADMLFDFIQTNMPEDNPGLLRAEEYAAVLAYIFQVNAFPPGDTPLPSNLEGLKRVLIDRPQHSILRIHR